MDHLLADPEPPPSSVLPGIPMGPTDELKDTGMIRESVWVLSIEVGAPVVRETPRPWDTAGRIAGSVFAHFFLALHPWS